MPQCADEQDHQCDDCFHGGLASLLAGALIARVRGDHNTLVFYFKVETVFSVGMAGVTYLFYTK
jgi:hypothetical protein